MTTPPRRVFFDTETTGISFAAGHRLVEIAAVEMLPDGSFGKTFRSLINPGRDIPKDATAVHGITNEQVASAPRFKDVIGPFLEFIRGAELLAHNAAFDEGFISSEMQAINHPKSFWQDIIRVVDTVPLARRLDPGAKKYSLDALLDRYEISREGRDFHNALLDSQLLAQLFKKMTAGVDLSQPSLEDDVERPPVVRLANPALVAVPVSALHESRHEAYLEALSKDSPNVVTWGPARSVRPTP